jgi:filamentous hemagglutinin
MDGTATSPYSSQGVQYGKTTTTDVNGYPVPVGTGGLSALDQAGANGALKTAVSGDLAASKVKWVDENLSTNQAARDYNDSATGARSNSATQSGQAPALERTLPDGSVRLVKFDGLDGDVLVDRKLAVVTTEKSQAQLIRQSDALSQNGLTGRWEVPTAQQAT